MTYLVQGGHWVSLPHMYLLKGSKKLVSVEAGAKRGPAKEDRMIQKVARVPFRRPRMAVHHAKLSAISLRSGPYADRDCLLLARSPACRRCSIPSDSYSYGWPTTSQKDSQGNPFHVLFSLLISSLVTGWQSWKACHLSEGLFHSLRRKTLVSI